MRRRCHHRVAGRRGIAAAESVVAMAVIFGITAAALKFAVVVSYNLHHAVSGMVGSPYL